MDEMVPVVSHHYWSYKLLCDVQIENLLEQLKDKDKQLAALRERVQGLQTDSSNTETALSTLEEALSEKVPLASTTLLWLPGPDLNTN